MKTNALVRAGLAIFIAIIFLAYVPTQARPPLERERIMGGIQIYYAPQQNLAEVDKALIASATARIDMAAYVLTDRGLMNELMLAARRGVKIRLYLDPDQPALRNANPSSTFAQLVSTSGIETRMKTDGRDLMHLKSYHVDGKVLRTGAANFSFSGMRYQDNDLVLIESSNLVDVFIKRFNTMWTRNGSQTVLPSQIGR